MRLSTRLLFAFALLLTMTLVVVAVVAYSSAAREVRGFMFAGNMTAPESIASDLGQFYAERGTWDGVETLLVPAHGPGPGGFGAMMGQRLVLVDSAGIVVGDSSGTLLGSSVAGEEIARGAPVVVKSSRVGTLLLFGGMSGVGLPIGVQESFLIGRVNRAIWLAAERTSPYQFYQYWINVDDADVGGCLRMLTELPREEIEALDAARAEDAAARASQTCLAEELTRLVHGDAGLAAARRATEIFFGAEIADLDDEQLGQIFADVPSQTVSKEQLSKDGGLSIVDALVSAGLAKSKGDARRTVEQGGAYVNNRRVAGVEARLTGADLASESVMVLRTGKKKYALLRFE